MKTYFKSLIACLGILTISASSYAEDVIVTIKNIENNKGNFRIGIFNGADGFENNKPYKMLTYSKQKVSNGTMTIRISLPPGEYGLSLLDDENKNEKMDFNMLHIPKEGFGFSDYYHTSLTMPKYNSFKFTLPSNNSKNVTVKIRYI